MTQAKAYYQDGTPVADEDLPRALQEGTAGYKASDSVSVVTPEGLTKQVTGEQIPELLSKGYAVESNGRVLKRELAAEYGSLQSQALGAAEAGLRGLSIGASDLVATEVLGADPEAMRLRQEYGGPITVGAEIAGAVAPALMSYGATAPLSGAGMATRLGLGAARAVSAPGRAVMAAGRAAEGFAARRLGAGLGGRALSAATGAAVEGAIGGAGMAVSDAALRDTELTAEHVLYGAGMGALLGGVAGGAARAIPESIGLGAQSAMARLAAEPSSEISEGAIASMAKRWRRAAALDAVTGGYLETTKGKQIAQIASEGLEDGTAGARLADKLDNVPAKYLAEPTEIARIANENADLSTNAMRQVAEQASASEVNVSLLKVADRVEKIAANADTSLLRDNTGKQLKRELKDLFSKAENGERISFGDAWKTRQALDDKIRSFRFDPKQSSLQKALREVRTELDDSLGSSLDEYGMKELSDKWKGSKSDVHEWLTIRDAAEHHAKMRNTGRRPHPVDTAAAAVTAALSLSTGNVAGVLGALAIPHALGIAKRNYSAYVSKLSGVIEKGNVSISGAAKAIAGTAKKRAKRSGKSSPVFGRNLSRGTVAPVAIRGPKLYESFVKAKSAINHDPEDQQPRADRIQKELGLHPAVAAQAAIKLESAQRYLNSVLPPSLSRADASPTPLSEEERIAPYQMRKYMSAFKGVTDPVSVIEDLSSGKIDRDAIKAVKSVYPRIWDELRTQVMLEAAKSGETMPYSTRIMLGIAFDFTSDRSLTPGFLSRMQSLSQDSGQGQPAQPAPKGANVSNKVAVGLDLPHNTGGALT